MAELSLRKKLFYGMGGLSMALPDAVLMQWLLVRYLPTDSEPLLPAALMGTLFFLERVTEGLSNPFLAYWSDTCQHRWGRRQPFMRLGIAPYLILYLLLFHPPVNGYSLANAAYLLVISQCYALFFAGVFTAYLALLPELTTDLKDRVDLTTCQAIFLMVAQLIFVSMGALFDRFGWTLPLLAVACIIALFFMPAMTLKEPHRAHGAHQQEGVFRAIRSAFGNRPFLYVAFSTGLYFFMLSAMIAMLPYWVKGYLELEDKHVTLVMAPFLGVTVIFFGVFNVLAKRLTKFVLLETTFLASGIVLSLLLLVDTLPGDPFFQTLLIIAALGAPAAGFMVLPYPILADVIDYDEKRTGRRREALFFGVQGVIQKTLLGLSMLCVTLAPYISGEKMESPVTLKFLVLAGASACGVAALVFTLYPLREQDGKIVVKNHNR